MVPTAYATAGARPPRGRLVGAFALTLAALCLPPLSGCGERTDPPPAHPDSPSGVPSPGPTQAAGAGPGAEPPLIMGRPEGCMVCHARTTGFSPAHRPEVIGCASCHRGDASTQDPGQAHRGMVRVPGNLADAARSCGQANCHPATVARVQQSIMATFAGVIDTNRRVFGQAAASGAAPPHARDLGHSAADSHLRQLCVACHLGNVKDEWGPITQESRGGGCNACHLKYSPEASKALTDYLATRVDAASAPGVRRAPPSVHPALSVQADGSHCFGCHSRSGRISTSYEGWHELHTDPTPAQRAASAADYRQLEDERTFVRVSADVHHERGLDCIDCHTALEVMGTGQTVAHKRQALRVRCEDCHAARVASLELADLDPESRKILALRNWTLEKGERVGATRGGDALVNVVVDAQGQARLRRKATGRTSPLRPAAAVCNEGAGHARLNCASCHTPWAPRCTRCHTAFDPKSEGYDHLSGQDTQGEWVESSSAFEAVPPTLGVRPATGVGERGGEVVDTFVPGMILTIDRNRAPGAQADTVFRRLYSPFTAHTIQRRARSCRSCHADPVALGFGQGQLRFDVDGPRGRWRYRAAQAASVHDGLPADAWTGFLAARTGMVSTRDGARPFSVPEQRRILTVGACLGCHADDSAVMRDAVRDFAALLRRRSPRCAVPVWN